MSTFIDREIHVEANKGHDVDKSIRDAAIEALTEDCPVVLRANEKTYRIDPDEMVRLIESGSAASIRAEDAEPPT